MHKLILTGCQNPAFESSLLNMHMTFWPPRLQGKAPKQGMEQVSEVTEVSNHFLESCHIKKKAV